MKCKACGHVFTNSQEYMLYCPCGKTFQDWMGIPCLYRYGGEFEFEEREEPE